MASEKVRIEIAFVSGQAVAVIVDVSTADALEGALRTAQEGAYSFEADDGGYTVPLGRIVYVKRFMRESPVGFGSS